MAYESNGSITTDERSVSVSTTWDDQTEWKDYQTATNVDITDGVVSLSQYPPTANLAHRYRASDLDLSDGDPVGSWPDSAGSEDLTATGTPVYVTETIGGEPGVRYPDDSDKHAVQFETVLSQPNEVYVVGRIESNTSSYQYIIDGYSSNVQAIRSTDTEDIDIQAGEPRLINGDADENGHIYTGLFNGTDSEIRIDTSVEVTGETGQADMDGLTVAARGGDQGNQIDVTIAEILVYDAEQTPSDRSETEEYLGDRYFSSPSSAFSNLNAFEYESDFDVSAQSSSIQGITFRPDGGAFYIPSYDDDVVNSYALGTAWDITTASLSGTLDISAQSTQPQSVAFNDDGSKIYIPTLNDEILEYDLSTPYDVATESYVHSETFDYLSESHPTAVNWNSDGSKAIIGAGQEDDITEWSASTAFDITSISLVDSYDAQNEIEADKLKSVTVENGGRAVLAPSGQGENAVYRWELSTPFDLSTITYKEKLDVSGQTSDAIGVGVKPDGSKLYVADNSNLRALEYE